MYLFALFEYSSKLEEAISALQVKGIGKDKILAVPLAPRAEKGTLFDSAHYSDNSNTFALPFVLALIGTLLGTIYGFQLYWGPVLWGLIGALSGFTTGFIITLIKTPVQNRHRRSAEKQNVILVVSCDGGQTDMVQSVLWGNAALALSVLDQG